MAQATFANGFPAMVQDQYSSVEDESSLSRLPRATVAIKSQFEQQIMP